ncbi:flagellar motor switch protein FliN [Craterilacuibacter sinensis]|uniref:Flagellar motor switch protein FliN n=1 Tax=Craterilacuibacter sinensis TaxID=2686017 RepID=A0A845BNC8_9NEIS|nr:flagellar motor switch protein FliN [Craterilacuibacter sinensis]MXR35806.1 flagellar motor switch protein FliN [Craterilacuibacter sinensis]
MEKNDLEELDNLLDRLDTPPAEAPVASAAPRDMSGLLRRIPVTLTLEVGEAEISLADLAAVNTGSVIELDKQAGEALDIRVNGTLIGRAEVVICGENYGLRITELNNLGLDALSS